MARPRKEGLSYFSFDTDFFFADRRIKALRARYGNNGLLFYIYLLTEIYRNGYYIGYDEDFKDNAMADLGITEGFIEQVISFLVSRSLIDKIILDNPDAVITSPGIQKRYQEAVKGNKRPYYVDNKIWLLGDEETATCIKVTQNPSYSEKNPSYSEKNPSYSEKNSTKENKRNKNKIKEINKEKSELDFERAWNNTVDRYPKKRREATAKQIWMKRLLAVEEEERVQLATDIFQAISLYLQDHRKKNESDVNYEYIPKFDEWLNEDCDYWLRQLENARCNNDRG